MNSDDRKPRDPSAIALADLRTFVDRGQQAQRAIDAILGEAPARCACCVDPKRVYPAWKLCRSPGCSHWTRGPHCPMHMDPSARQGAPDGEAQTPTRTEAIPGVGETAEGPPASGRSAKDHGPRAGASRRKGR